MSFLTEFARTKGFRLGAPRDVAISPDGARVLFLRAAAGDDPVTSLWEYDVRAGTERLVADGAALAGGAALTAAERARRERAREQAAGIVAYSTDEGCHRVAFALDGALWTATVDGDPAPVRLPTAGTVVDPRLDPTGTRIAYVADGALRVVGIDGTGDIALATPEQSDVSYGLAEHVAGESMHRNRGYWWSPDGTRLLVSRVDTAAVTRAYIGDPADPRGRPVAVAYPFAGTTNADVRLFGLPVDGAAGVEIRYDRAAFEYLAAVTWPSGEPLLLVQSRDQRDVQIRSVDPVTGETTLVHADHDDAWWELVPGLPARTADGALVWTVDDGDTRRLVVDGAPVTPPGLQVRSVSRVDGAAVLFVGGEESTEAHVWRWTAEDGPVRLTEQPGVHTGFTAGGTVVLLSRALTHAGVRTVVRSAGVDREIRSVAHQPSITVRVALHSFGSRELRGAVLLPTGYQRGGPKLPVLLDPYGGPHGQVAVKARNVYTMSQWFADQGYAVLISDGRGTPGRGPRWEHAIHHEKLGLALDDQIDALHAAAETYPELDLGRVGIRGWSYGGYLAAAAVLRRPEVFHVAVAGAPVTDPLLYDSHWQERYLGHPDVEPEVYQRNSLIPDAPKLSRPLMLIHGLADDNVFFAHTLRLSGALLAAGREHTVLPLAGVTHMASDEAVAANLPRLELAFLDRALRPA